MALTLALSTLPASAGIIPYRDERGRLVYVNSRDRELYTAARRGGVSAALRLIERRKQRIPGIEEHIEKTALAHNVDPKLVNALIDVESAWNPRARSSKGALGLMQLMPATAKRFGVRNPFDPSDNVRGGVRNLRHLLDQYDNNLTLTLAAYNAGEGAVRRHGGVPPYEETQNYIKRVRSIYGTSSTGRPSRQGLPGGIYLSVDRNGRLVYEN